MIYSICISLWGVGGSSTVSITITITITIVLHKDTMCLWRGQILLFPPPSPPPPPLPSGMKVSMQ